MDRDQVILACTSSEGNAHSCGNVGKKTSSSTLLLGTLLGCRSVSFVKLYATTSAALEQFVDFRGSKITKHPRHRGRPSRRRIGGLYHTHPATWCCSARFQPVRSKKPNAKGEDGG
jgi:hypothetical protein